MDDSMDFIPSGGSVSSSSSSSYNNNGLSISNDIINDKNKLQSSSNTNTIISTDYIDNIHPSHVLNNLDRFRLRNFMCDIEIEVDGNVFSAHRYVLAAAIPYFNSMFASEMRESRQKRIVIQDLSCDSFRQLLDFAYTSHVNINADNVQQLLYTASILQMDTVCNACQNFLTQYLTITNCLSIRQFAEQHNCISLLSFVDDFIMQHFRELRRVTEFQMIPIGHLLDLLRSSDLKVNSEEEVFETVIEWVKRCEDERKKYLPELLINVRLPLLPISYFLDRVNKHPLIMENVECRDLIADAMSEIMRCQFNSSITTSLTEIHRKQSTSTNNNNVWRNCRPRKSAAGVIFCVGGRGATGDPFRSVEAYDLRHDKWIAVNDMGVRRRHVGVVSAFGKLYAIGGHDGSNHLDSAECFDPETNLWQRVASMDTHRRGIAIGALEGAIYAVGGLDDSACFQTVERYDIESDKWSLVASMNIQRGGVGVATLGKYLFAIGGNDGTSSLDSCERYDPFLNKWKMIASMKHRRAGAGVTVLNGYLYAIGGFDDNAPLASCERYNVNDDSWTLLSTMSCPRGGVGVASMAGRIYAIGGHDGVRYLNSVETYDPLINQWIPIAPIAQCRAGAGVAWADCHIDSLSTLTTNKEHAATTTTATSTTSTANTARTPCLSAVAHCV